MADNSYIFAAVSV